MTKNSIETIEKEITNQLIESEGLLFSKLPNLCIKYGVIEDTYIKSNATNKTKNTFKEAFPVLDNLMEGTFDAINFTYFEKPQFHFEFEYKNKKYETGVSARELLTTISDLIKTPNDNSKTFYYLPSTIWEKLYLYISPLQAEEISSLFDVNLERLDIK